MRLTRTAPAAMLPVTLAEAKAHLRVTHSDEDDKIEALVEAATGFVEDYTGRALVEQTWKLTLDAFADAIQLPLGPVLEVVSVNYIDTAGIEQTVPEADYTADLATIPAWVVRNASAAWPATIEAINAVSVTFTAGHDPLPAAIRHALLLTVGHWYRNTESVVTGGGATELPLGVAALLGNHRSFGF